MVVERMVSPRPTGDEETAFERSVRPTTLDEFVGQERLKSNLSIFIQAALKRGERLDHTLLSGGPGLGKTTLAAIIAREMRSNITTTSGPALERARDLVGVLTSLEPKDVLFIDEIHRIPAPVAEYLHGAMEDFKIELVVDKGPSARTIPIRLEPFTLVGATTREGLLSGPFRARFGIPLKLDFYPPEELEQIIVRSAGILEIELQEEAALQIARRARGTPRIANRLLRRLRDFATTLADGVITLDVVLDGLKRLGIDEAGLDEMDRKILRCIISHGGVPVGLKTIAVTVGEENDTIEEVHEPHLIQKGFLRKTPRGRVASAAAYEHLDIAEPEKPPQGKLF